LVVLDIGGRGDVVGRVGIVSTKVDDHKVSGLLLAKVPGLRLILSSSESATCPAVRKRMRRTNLTSPDLVGTPASVRRVEPLVALAPRVAPAVLVRNTDSRYRCDGIFRVAQTLADTIGKPGEGLVGVVHARRE